MKKKVHVVGAGIAGLSAAYFLKQNGFNVTVYESQSRVGGLVGTQKTPFGIAETGAHAFLNTELLETTCAQLGVSLIAAKPLSKRNRFFEHAGLITRWPLGFWATLRCLLGVVLLKFLPPRRFESVDSWACRVFGVQAARFLLRRVLQGIYAASTKKLSATLIFGRFYKSKKQNLVFKKPKIKGSVAPVGGMIEFCEALAQNLKNAGKDLRCDFVVTPQMLQDWRNKEDLIVIAVPIWKAPELIESFDPDFANLLKQVPVIPIEATTVFWDREKIPTLPPGFGVLLDSNHGHSDDSMLGVLQNDQIFEGRIWGQGVVSETWISRGSTSCLEDLKIKRQKLLGKPVLPEAVLEQFCAQWTQGLPLFGQELELAMREYQVTKLETQGIYMVGNYMGEIGISKILQRSKTLADRLLAM